MKRIKKWLMERYFPAQAKVVISQLEAELRKKDIEIAELNAYIDGLEAGLRVQRRIVINNNKG